MTENPLFVLSFALCIFSVLLITLSLFVFSRRRFTYLLYILSIFTPIIAGIMYYAQLKPAYVDIKTEEPVQTETVAAYPVEAYQNEVNAFVLEYHDANQATMTVLQDTLDDDSLSFTEQKEVYIQEYEAMIQMLNDAAFPDPPNTMSAFDTSFQAGNQHQIKAYKTLLEMYALVEEKGAERPSELSSIQQGIYQNLTDDMEKSIKNAKDLYTTAHKSSLHIDLQPMIDSL